MKRNLFPRKLPEPPPKPDRWRILMIGDRIYDTPDMYPIIPIKVDSVLVSAQTLEGAKANVLGANWRDNPYGDINMVGGTTDPRFAYTIQWYQGWFMANGNWFMNLNGVVMGDTTKLQILSVPV